MDLVKLNQNGQVSIPASLRKKWGLKTGDLFRVEEDETGRVILVPVTVAEKNTGVDMGLLLSSLRKTPTERAETNKEMLKFIEEARKARSKRAHAHS